MRPDNAFPHDYRVSWGHCDPAQIAYTGHIPWFAIDAIDAWWDHYLGKGGFFHLEMDRNVGTPFVHLSMDFHAPVTPRHRLTSYVWPTKLGTKSITFRVDGTQDGKDCFSGTFTCVFTVADQFKSQAAPQDFRDIITPLIPE